MNQQNRQSKSCFCGCCTLRSGSLIILWVFLIANLSSIFDYARTRSDDGYFGFSFFASNLLAVNLIAIALCGLKISEPQFMIPYISLAVLEIAIAIVALILLLVSSPVVLHSGIIEYGFTLTYKINQTVVQNFTWTDEDSVSFVVNSNGVFYKNISSATIVGILAATIGTYIIVKGFAIMILYRHYRELVEESQESRIGPKNDLVYVPRNNEPLYGFSQSLPPPPPPFPTGQNRLSSTFEEHKI